MTEEQENLPVSATKEKVAKEKSAKEKVAKDKKPTIWPLWLLSVLIIGALGSVSFFGWHQLSRIDSIQAEFQQMHQREQNLLEKNTQLSTELRSLAQQKEQQTESLKKAQRETTQKLAELSTTLLQMGGASRTEWLLAEAEYLLRLANQRLNIEKDPAGATAVLKAADKVLVEADDAGLFDIRKKLSEEILAMEMVSQSDSDGLYLKLEAMINGIDNLEQTYFLKENSAKKQHRSNTSMADAAPQGTWDKIKTELNKLVNFRRLDAPVEPLLSPEQTYYLKQNLRLMLEQAQLALLKKNEALYQSSLKKSSKWIAQHFQKDEAPVRVIQKTLSELVEQKIDPELPDISGSLNLLKARIKLLYKQHALSKAERGSPMEATS